MKKTIKSITLSALLILMAAFTAANAQQQTSQKDSVVNKLASTLSVSKEKAAQLTAVLRYRGDELRSLIANIAMAQKEKLQLIKQIQEERKQKIDSAFTPQQKEAYRQQHAPLLQRTDAIKAAIEQQETEKRRLSQAKQGN